MKTLIMLLVTGLSFSAQALDTSGCRFQLTNQQTQTASGKVLRVQQSMINSQSCWNADQSSVNLSYEWMQNQSTSQAQVLFWLDVNGQQKNAQASVRCQAVNGLSYGKETTSASILYRCVATAQVLIGYQKSVSVEVAPAVNGQWDTRGYQQNYKFQF